MDEVGSMPTSSIKIERACHYQLRSLWNYVGRHGADKSLTCSPLQLSGGQLETVTTTVTTKDVSHQNNLADSRMISECFRCPSV